MENSWGEGGYGGGVREEERDGGKSEPREGYEEREWLSWSWIS